MRPFDSHVLLAVRYANFHRTAAAAALVIRGRELHHIDSAIAGPCPFCTKQDVIAGHRRIWTGVAITQTIHRLILGHGIKGNGDRLVVGIGHPYDGHRHHHVIRWPQVSWLRPPD